MKNTLIAAPWIALILVLIYITQCQKQSKPEMIIHDSIQIVHTIDSFPVEGKTIYYPTPYEVVKYDTTFKDVDTLKIIQNYLTENKYTFNINDSTGNIDVFISVKYNQLSNYSWKGYFKTYTKTITDTKYKDTPKRNKLLVGVILSGNADRFGSAPVLGLKTKKDNVFVAGYDVINGSYQFGYMVGIGKR